MWNFFRNRRLRLAAEEARMAEERAAERDSFLQTLTIIAENFSRASQAQAEQIGALAQAQAASAKAFSDHLALFNVTESPTSRVIRDTDEFVREQVHTKGLGIPPGLTPAQQLQWVLDNSTDPEW